MAGERHAMCESAFKEDNFACFVLNERQRARPRVVTVKQAMQREVQSAVALAQLCDVLFS
jgi:hypothetical protein